MAAGATEAQPSRLVIKPYCGARPASKLPVEETRLAGREIHGRPVPAWADIGVASHLQGICGVVPSPKPSPARSAPALNFLRNPFHQERFALRLSLGLFAVVETVMCYLAFLETREPEKSFYNKFEAHTLGMPGLDTALLALAILSTVYLFVSWALLSVVQLDLHVALAAGRMLLSLPSGLVCAILVFVGESTKVFPFVCSVFGLLYLQAVLLGLLPLLPEEARRRRRALLGAAGLVAAVTVAWVLMFALDGVAFLRDASCVATQNAAMPVRLKGLDEWQCVRWGVPHQIRRIADAADRMYVAQCSTTFRVFDRVSGAGIMAPSTKAHTVQCPSLCQTLGFGSTVIGCGVYDARSSVCAAAVQAGLLRLNEGGTVTVIGRPPPLSGQYERCNEHGIASTSRVIPPSNSSNSTEEWAFYFQVEGTRGLDFVTLHGWRTTGTPGTWRPWQSYVADVSWALGGEQVRRQEVTLGPAPDDQAMVEVNFCRAKIATQPPRCP